MNAASIHAIDAANPLEIVMALTFAGVGGLIASQRSRNPVGWLFLFMAIVMGAGGFAAQYARLAAITHPGLPGAQWALWWYVWSEQLVYPAGGAIGHPAADSRRAAPLPSLATAHAGGGGCHSRAS